MIGKFVFVYWTHVLQFTFRGCYVKCLSHTPSLSLLSMLKVNFKIKPHINLNLLLICYIIICEYNKIRKILFDVKLWCENCWETVSGQHSCNVMKIMLI